MIIMLLGTSMPMLYLSGLLLCACVYWGSKWLFLRYYRSPPKYGLELAIRVRSLIELSALIHAFFGCYMITNPEIFPVQRILFNGDNLSFYETIALITGKWTHAVFGIDEDRFASLHGVAYLVGNFILLTLYIVERASGFFSGLLNMKCCCLRKYQEHEIKFSTNLYQEINAMAVESEYN